jgi:hypothetical protein
MKIYYLNFQTSRHTLTTSWFLKYMCVANKPVLWIRIGCNAIRIQLFIRSQGVEPTRIYVYPDPDPDPGQNFK